MDKINGLQVCVLCEELLTSGTYCSRCLEGNDDLAEMYHRPILKRKGVKVNE